MTGFKPQLCVGIYICNMENELHGLGGLHIYYAECMRNVNINIIWKKGLEMKYINISIYRRSFGERI